MCHRLVSRQVRRGSARHPCFPERSLEKITSLMRQAKDDPLRVDTACWGLGWAPCVSRKVATFDLVEIFARPRFDPAHRTWRRARTGRMLNSEQQATEAVVRHLANSRSFRTLLRHASQSPRRSYLLDGSPPRSSVALGSRGSSPAERMAPSWPIFDNA